MTPSRLATALTAVLVFWVVSPAFDGGFLADDYYVGREIHNVWTAANTPLDSIVATFSHRWTAEFDVLRPLTLLTIQADYALFGADGGRHHWLNVLLWVFSAVMISRLSVRLTGQQSPVFAAVVTLAVGCFPAGVETLGWLVAREDLLAAVFGLVALRAFLKDAASPWLRLLFLGLALASKETAVVIPIILGWMDLAGYPRDGAPLKRRVLRHVPDALLLVGYMLLRHAMFGRVGGDYGGKPFGHYLTDEHVLGTIGSGLLTNFEKLVAPINLAQLFYDHGPIDGARWISLLLFGLPVVAIVVAAGRGLGWRAPLSFGGWMLLPLLLLAPIPQIHVGADMSVSRILLLPSLAYALLLATAAHAALVQERRVIPVIAGLWLAVLGASAMRLNLGAYRDAARQAETILDAFSPIPAGEAVLFCGQDEPNRPGVFRPALVQLRGAWVLSAGLFDGLHPPFRAERLEVRALANNALDLLAEVPSPRPFVVRIAPVNERIPLGAQIVARGGETSTTLPATLTPAHGGSLDRTQTPRFAATFNAHDAPFAGARYRLEGISALGGHVTASGALPEAQKDPVSGTETIRLVVEGIETTPPLTSALLALLPDPIVLWWVTLEVDGQEVRRSEYQALRVR